ncbi:MAG: UDP-N-acetylmuramate dehydrogenase, partial [Candidatus Marinimicrobia bacterium]|nr:UDP-N-acetylmuramate dehydrogenase [Candidatus Neomarinimicrobiota bacterium]
NLLFCDDFQGVVILNRIKGIEVVETDEAYHLHVGSGEDWHELVTWTLQNDMPGMENLALIPGCVGSAPIQNIGAYGVELKDLCEYVDILDLRSGEVKRLSADECQFGYRDSIFKHEYKDNITITAVGLYLPKTWHPKLSYGPLADLANDSITAKNIYDRVCQLRQSKLPDPKVCGNAGSFFKNPVISNTLLNKLKEEYPTMPSYAAGV